MMMILLEMFKNEHFNEHICCVNGRKYSLDCILIRLHSIVVSLVFGQFSFEDNSIRPCEN